jgi:hypothetical protein
MRALDQQNSQEQRPWVQPQLSELDINTQTQNGPWSADFELSWNTKRWGPIGWGNGS